MYVSGVGGLWGWGRARVLAEPLSANPSIALLWVCLTLFKLSVGKADGLRHFETRPVLALDGIPAAPLRKDESITLTHSGTDQGLAASG